jgi:hypothetical protein
MQENRAAETSDARALVVISGGQNIIATVLAPKFLVALRKWQFYGSIVAVAGHIIAPSEIRFKTLDIDWRSWPRHAV